MLWCFLYHAWFEKIFDSCFYICVTAEYDVLCGGGDAPAISEDFNECAAWPELCGAGKCKNLLGSHECECPRGYTLNARGELLTVYPLRFFTRNHCTLGSNICSLPNLRHGDWLAWFIFVNSTIILCYSLGNSGSASIVFVLTAKIFHLAPLFLPWRSTVSSMELSYHLPSKA